MPAARGADSLLGGLGFFLGGIGPDGHVGFNIRGSDHLSTTRLMATNYETQAAAAGDLGGIEVARQRLVITIGLGTITYNPQCVAIIIAAGEAKAGVVSDAVEGEKSIRIPGSALRVLPNARFYVTLGAARKLGRRQVSLVSKAGQLTDEQLERAVIDLALARNKRILDLTEVEAGQAPMLRMVLGGRQQSMADAAAMVHERIIEKINRGSQSSQGTRFLHTEPHHDDLMLGIMPHIVRNMRNPTNDHYFVTLTSGFTAVTNLFMLRQLEGLKGWIDSETFRSLYVEGYFDTDNEQGRNRDVWRYLDGIAAKNEDMRAEGARRLLRNLMEVYDESKLKAIRDRMTELEHYFSSVYPGGKDHEAVQRLRGMCREWEASPLGLIRLAMLASGTFAWGSTPATFRSRTDRGARRQTGAPPAGGGPAGRSSPARLDPGQAATPTTRCSRQLARRPANTSRMPGRQPANLGLPQRLVPFPSQRSQRLRCRFPSTCFPTWRAAPPQHVRRKRRRRSPATPTTGRSANWHSRSRSSSTRCSRRASAGRGSPSTPAQ